MADEQEQHSYMLSYRDSEIEEMLVKVAGMGWWQWLLLAFLSLSAVSICTSSYAMLFFCPPGIHYWCKPPDDVPDEALDAWILATHPYKWYTRENINACQYYQLNYTTLMSGKFSMQPTDLTKCTKFVFSKELHGVTLYEEFDLTCENESYVQILQLVFECGLIIGNILFGYLGDRFGRKIPLFVSLGLQPLVGLCVAFGKIFSVFVVLWFVYGLVVSGGIILAHVLLLEIVGNRKRSLMAGLFTLSACVGFIMLPLLHQLVWDWQKLQVIVSTPIILFLVFVGFIPESPMWLLLKRKPKKATAVVLKAARINRRYIPSTFLIRPLGEQALSDEACQNIWNIFSHLNIVKATIALCVMYFGMSLVTRLLILTISLTIVKQIFLTFVIAGAMGLFAFILGVSAVQRFKYAAGNTRPVGPVVELGLGRI